MHPFHCFFRHLAGLCRFMGKEVPLVGHGNQPILKCDERKVGKLPHHRVCELSSASLRPSIFEILSASRRSSMFAIIDSWGMVKCTAWSGTCYLTFTGGV